MPKRKKTIRVNAESVQGDDAYVVLRRRTVAEMRAILSGQDTDEEDSLAILQRQIKAYRDHVVEWNWVDDDDAPLPQIADDPAVVELLTDAELGFLARALGGAEEEMGN